MNPPRKPKVGTKTKPKGTWKDEPVGPVNTVGEVREFLTELRRWLSKVDKAGDELEGELKGLRSTKEVPRCKVPVKHVKNPVVVAAIALDTALMDLQWFLAEDALRVSRNSAKLIQASC